MEERIMRSNHHSPWQLFIIISAFSVCLVLGCGFDTQMDFTLAEKPQKTILFDRYSVEISGYKDRIYDYVTVDVELINPNVDTAMVDSIPRLVVDSVCFDAPCLGYPDCFVVLHPDTQKLERYLVPNEYFPYPDSQPKSDLYFLNGQCYVGGFQFAVDDRLRLKCSKKEVTASLYARILDRRTGLLLATEVKKAPYQVKVKTRFYIKDE
jgi:hypothetical protein